MRIAILAGASYTIGSATVYGGYSDSKWNDIGIDTRVYGLSAKYQLNPASYVSLGYAILRDKTQQNNNADQLGFMVEYDVSKRTNVYGALSFLRNRNQAECTVAGAANAGLALAYPVADARGVQIGVVHRF